MMLDTWLMVVNDQHQMWKDTVDGWKDMVDDG